MKNRPFYIRLRYAWTGIKSAWRTESSFRAQCVLGMGAAAVLLVLKPEPLWWAIFAVIIAAVLAAELFNTALERVIDRLHPEIHPLIALAKDCAAGAVLVLSLGALGVLAALLYSKI
jgi:diacylglycerol kinase (ATP)